MLIALMVKMRITAVQEFKIVIENLIKLLTDRSTSEKIKEYTIKILRHLANFRAN